MNTMLALLAICALANDPTTPTLFVANALAPSEQYFIRIVPRDENGRTRVFTNPSVAEDGVLGYAVRLATVDTVLDPQLTTDAQPAEKPKNVPKPASGNAAKPAPQPAPASTPAPAPKPPPAAQPTLDELLGLPKSPPPDKPTNESGKPADVAPDGGVKDPNQAELDDLLAGKQIADAFSQAVSLMGDASKRLGGANDPGIDTQRIQEDIIKKLEQVLDGMQQQQQQQSSSKSKQQQRQTPQQPQSSQKSQQQASQPSQGDNRTETTPPGLQQGALKPTLEGARAAWGSLPQRVRDMLLQGSGDRFSAKYQAMTEAYYRKLAEDKENR